MIKITFLTSNMPTNGGFIVLLQNGASYPIRVDTRRPDYLLTTSEPSNFQIKRSAPVGWREMDK